MLRQEGHAAFHPRNVPAGALAAHNAVYNMFSLAMQVLVNFLEVEDIGQGSCAGRIAQESSVLMAMRSMLEELPPTRDSRDLLENMLKIIWVVVRRDRRSVSHALPAGVLFSALQRLKDIIHKNSVNEALSTCVVLLAEGSSGTDLETCKRVINQRPNFY